MSWRLGFFRIWVLLTVIYVAVVGVISYDQVANPWLPDRAYVFRVTVDDLRGNYPGLSGVALEDAVWRDFYQDLSREEFSARLEAMKTGLPSIVEEHSAQYRNYEAGIEKGDLKKLPIEGVPGIFLITRTTTDPEKVTRRMNQVQPMAVDLRSALISEKRAAAIWGALGAALIPPALFLLLGFGLAWVLAGFRRPRDGRRQERQT